LFVALIDFGLSFNSAGEYVGLYLAQRYFTLIFRNFIFNQPDPSVHLILKTVNQKQEADLSF